MDGLETGLQEVELVKSVTGGGRKLAAAIVAEIGDGLSLKKLNNLWLLQD